MQQNFIAEALKKLDVIDDSAERYAWIIDDADDVLDPSEHLKDLKEGISFDMWNSLMPCDVVYCKTSVQHSGETAKRRPMLFLYKTGSADSPLVYGMQITTVGPSGGYRTKFRYALQDWKSVGLAAPSYINYDHLIRNVDDDVSVYTRAWLTTRDAKGLLHDIETNYSDLIRLGYATPQDKQLLDNFIRYLKIL